MTSIGLKGNGLGLDLTQSQPMTSSEEEEGVWTFDVVYKSGKIVNKFNLNLGHEKNRLQVKSCCQLKSRGLSHKTYYGRNLQSL